MKERWLRMWSGVTQGRGRRIAMWGAVISVAVGIGYGLGKRAAPEMNEAASAAQAGAAAERGAVVWTCSMHPQIRQDHPGKCPLCGMDLIPAGDADDADGAGPNTVVLSERAKILARIRTAPVRRVDAAPEVRLLGRVVAAETAAQDVTTWISGRIDKLFIEETGVRIRAGQAVARLYSPEVYAAHQDLLSARKQVQRLAAASPGARSAAEAAVEAARTRLRLLGLLPKQIAAMEKAAQPTTHVTIRSPFSGTVLERVATEGAYVQTGAVLYRLANLSTVWVQLEAYERDLPRLEVGQNAVMRPEGMPDTAFSGTVAFIDPVVDPRRRIAKVRVEVANPDRRLKPGMFVTAQVRGKGGEYLVIPKTAPLFTGKRAVVFVERPHADRPTYDAREVRLGVETPQGFPVIAGLSEGEMVVEKGAFALDADLQIQGGYATMARPDDTVPPADVIDVPAAVRTAWAPVLSAYLAVQEALADDDADAAQAGLADLRAALDTVAISAPDAAAHRWRTARAKLGDLVASVSHPARLEALRAVFEPLSNQVIGLLVALGNPLDVTVHHAFCPMAMGSKGAFWVQRAPEVINPYYGHAMRTCGELRAAVAPGSHLLITDGAPAQTPTGASGAHAHHHGM